MVKGEKIWAGYKRRKDSSLIATCDSESGTLEGPRERFYYSGKFKWSLICLTTMKEKITAHTCSFTQSISRETKLPMGQHIIIKEGRMLSFKEDKANIQKKFSCLAS